MEHYEMVQGWVSVAVQGAGGGGKGGGKESPDTLKVVLNHQLFLFFQKEKLEAF
jgi:hypothetical protein